MRRQDLRATDQTYALEVELALAQVAVHFVATYRALAEKGKADEIGSAEYRRVVARWLEERRGFGQLGREIQTLIAE